MTVADNLGLDLSHLANPRPTRFADNPQDTNSILDLVFLEPNNLRFGRHILLDLQKPSDHILLIINVGIKKENFDLIIQSIKKDNTKEENFISSIIRDVKLIDTSSITNRESLQNAINQLTGAFEKVWAENSKPCYITKHSKE